MLELQPVIGVEANWLVQQTVYLASKTRTAGYFGQRCGGVEVEIGDEGVEGGTNRLQLGWSYLISSLAVISSYVIFAWIATEI